MTATKPEFKAFIETARSIIIGKDREVRLALTCLLANGHLLIEDLPGVGKTTFVMMIARLAGLELRRIQFTNDLLPSDILGTHIYDTAKGSFQFQPGPIFGEVVLGDELNRATPKTQSAFLQAMEEHQITLDGKSYPLPNPFFLIATQNPSQQIGTFPLPESQLDRFMMKIRLNYPDRASEKAMLTQGDTRSQIHTVAPAITKSQLLAWQREVSLVHTSDHLIEYVQDLMARSREMNPSMTGLSPRAGILLIQASKAAAFIEGRKMVLPEDVQFVAASIMSHRLGQNDDNDLFGGDALAAQILSTVKVP